MLEQLRRGAGTWFAKILLGLLMISFAFWGVSGVFSGIGQGTLATVGDVEITTQRFQTALRSELAILSTRLGRRISQEQARAFGLEQRVLSRLMGGAAVDNHAADLNLGISSDTIVTSIMNDRNFKGSDGKFSPIAFDQALRQLDMDRVRFISIQRREKVEQQLTGTLVGSLVPPAPMIDVLHHYQNEKRQLKYFTLDAKIAGKVKAPDEKALKAHYEDNKRQFVTPPYRKVALLFATRDMAVKRVPITDDELRKVYEQTRAQYDVAEKRRIQQLAFPDKAAAQKAYGILSKTKDFEAAAKKLGFAKTDYEIGEFTPTSMIDDKVAVAAFKLKKGKLSRPVEGSFSTVLLKVTSITPGKKSTFEDAKADIKKKLANERVSQELQKMHDEVDDQRGVGKTLQESASDLKLAFLDIENLDAEGKNETGKNAITIASITPADRAKIAGAIFSGAIGVENNVIDLADGGYAWFDIFGETASKQKPYEDVKDDVSAIVLDLAKRKAIATAAREAVEKIKKGTAFAEVARQNKVKLVTLKPIKRLGPATGLNAQALERAFALKLNGTAAVVSSDNQSRTIISVVKIIQPDKPTTDEKKALRSALTQQMGGDVINQYISALLARYGQSVNQATFRRTTGQEQLQPTGTGGLLSGLF